MQKDNNDDVEAEVDEVYRRTIEIKKWLENIKKSETKNKDDELDR